MEFDFEEMRMWVASLPCDPRVRRARLICFDLMRYKENYEELINFIEVLKEDD